MIFWVLENTSMDLYANNNRLAVMMMMMSRSVMFGRSYS